MRKKVACFFTGGYTEWVEMRGFLQRIRDDLDYDQRLPTRPRKSRRPQMLPTGQSGLTGKSLTQAVYAHLGQYRNALSDYSAVLIEDDLDDKFSYLSQPGVPSSLIRAQTPQYFAHCNAVRTQVRHIMNKPPTFPVILLYASPEIETWFLADWGNTFGSVYGPEVMNVLNTDENQFFSNRFGVYVDKNVLPPYNRNPGSQHIEHYGYFGGTYHKLSNVLLQGLDNFKIGLFNSNTATGRKIANESNLRYSKNSHGSEMLKRLNPDNLYGTCPYYFATAVNELRKV